MNYQYTENVLSKKKTIKAKGFLLKFTNVSFIPIISIYFSFVAFITKPLYLFYARSLTQDALAMNNISVENVTGMANIKNRQLSFCNKTNRRQ